MNKIILIVVFFATSFLSFGGDSDLFKVNDEKLEEEFSELILLEQKIEQGKDVDITQLNEKLMISISLIEPEKKSVGDEIAQACVDFVLDSCSEACCMFGESIFDSL